jgi:hypothetical protein
MRWLDRQGNVINIATLMMRGSAAPRGRRTEDRERTGEYPREYPEYPWEYPEYPLREYPEYPCEYGGEYPAAAPRGCPLRKYPEYPGSTPSTPEVH